MYADKVPTSVNSLVHARVHFSPLMRTKATVSYEKAPLGQGRGFHQGVPLDNDPPRAQSAYVTLVTFMLADSLTGPEGRCSLARLRYSVSGTRVGEDLSSLRSSC
jgi:hypothetical protein